MTMMGQITPFVDAVPGVVPNCPICKKHTDVTWNWFNDDNGGWYHECHECDILFATKILVTDRKAPL